VSERHVAIIGNVNVDMIMGPQAPWPEPGTEVVLPDYELRVGGQAGNTALALSALSVPFRLYGNAGDDVLGRWLKASFGRAAEHWRLSEQPTTVSVGMTHPNGERTFFTSAGHLEDFRPEDVIGELPATVLPGSVALLVGTFLSPRLVGSFPELLTTLTKVGFAIALDTGWPPLGWSEAVRARLAGWLGATDLLLVNEAEALGFSAATDLTAAVATLRSKLPADATLVVKRGAEGASAWRRDQMCSAVPPRIDVADSIGAGDIFNAGFLAARLTGASVAKCLEAGVRYASKVIATRPRSYAP
jgi:sugar/nucleoside kinase (ribokinase family)